MRPGKSLVVVSIHIYTVTVAVKRNDSGYHRLYIDDKEVGSPDWDTVYPPTAEMATVKLSFGREKHVLSAPLPCWRYNPVSRKRYKVDQVFPTALTWELSLYPSIQKVGQLAFEDLQSLSAGDCIMQGIDWPFMKQADGSVTNNVISFPPTRPYQGMFSCKGKLLNFGYVSTTNWPLLLDVIEGKYLSEILKHAQVTKWIEKREHEKRQQALKEKIVGACYKGSDFDGDFEVEVGFGKRLILSGHIRGTLLHIVDSPDYGTALYIFSRLTDARAWAAGSMDWRTAKQRSVARIPHNVNWEEKVRKRLCSRR
jgi:hypothetical protein